MYNVPVKSCHDGVVSTGSLDVDAMALMRSKRLARSAVAVQLGLLWGFEDQVQYHGTRATVQ
jgi:hypothetical protein